MGKHFGAIAERILTLGAKPPLSLADCLKLSSVRESSATVFTSREVLDTLIADLGALRADYKVTRAVAKSSSNVRVSKSFRKLEW